MGELPGPTRRWLLGWVGLAAVGGLLGTSGCIGDGGPVEPPEQPGCVARSSLESYRSLRSLPLVYEVTGRRARFRLEPGFAGQLEGWLGRLAGSGVRPDQLWTYGTWTDGGGSCRSWHNSGRAFDLARVRLRGGGFLSCRYDRWRTASGAALQRSLRDYWAVAAGLHLEFDHVLTYLYDANHHNHIHVDNGRSGAGPSTFRPRSPAQVQSVQAIATHLWDRPTTITGEWDRATRRITGDILTGLDAPNDLTTPEGWRAYLTASAARLGD